jgi:HEPN domain-containing protein
MDKDVKRWLDVAAYDRVTAEAMYKSGRYLYVLFMCQQAVEKTLKGLIVQKTGKFPPRTHDLLKLAELANIEIASPNQELLRELVLYYIETRYPEDISKISSTVDKKIAYNYLKKTKELLKWLKENLK